MWQTFGRRAERKVITAVQRALCLHAPILPARLQPQGARMHCSLAVVMHTLTQRWQNKPSSWQTKFHCVCTLADLKQKERLPVWYPRSLSCMSFTECARTSATQPSMDSFFTTSSFGRCPYCIMDSLQCQGNQSALHDICKQTASWTTSMIESFVNVWRLSSMSMAECPKQVSSSDK